MGSVNRLVLWLLLTFIPEINSLISVAGGVAAAMFAGIYTAYTPMKCYFKECYTSDGVPFAASAPREDLQTRVFGQDLAIDVIMRHLQAHMTTNPVRALALSFHGGAGTGKTHVRRIIAEGLYRKGMRSKCVQFVLATREFKYKDKVPLYKMPTGLIGTLTPYLDFHEQLSGTDYRKAIFLFLSNTAGKEINNHTLQHWSSRERIGLKEMEQLISKATVNSKSSGMFMSDVIIMHLITAHVPFLPLERKHVKMCIKDYLVARNYYIRGSVPEEIVQKVIKELIFSPDDMQLFSVNGCKCVPDKVDYVIYDGYN